MSLSFHSGNILSGKGTGLITGAAKVTEAIIIAPAKDIICHSCVHGSQSHHSLSFRQKLAQYRLTKPLLSRGNGPLGCRRKEAEAAKDSASRFPRGKRPAQSSCFIASSIRFLSKFLQRKLLPFPQIQPSATGLSWQYLPVRRPFDRKSGTDFSA